MLFKRQPSKIELLLEQMITQNSQLSQKQIDIIDNQSKLIHLMESGFNSANLLSMKQSLERTEEKVANIEMLNQRITDLNSHITKLIDVTTALSLTVGRLSMQVESKPQIKPELPTQPISKEPEIQNRKKKLSQYALINYLQDKNEVSSTELQTVFNIGSDHAAYFIKRLIESNHLEKISKNRYKVLH